MKRKTSTTVKFKYLTATLELLLAIPFLSDLFVLVTLWIPLLVTLCLHIVTLIVSRNTPGIRKTGSILGIISSIVGAIPFVSIVFHLVTFTFLIRDAMKPVDKQIAIENAYMKEIKPYLKEKYDIATDTNFLMKFEEILLKLYKETEVYLYLPLTVFHELEAIKKDNERAYLAQKGFDIIEYYQKENRLIWIDKSIKASSNDEKIVLSVLKEIQDGQKLLFASDDKGARILARNNNIPVIDVNYNFN